MMNFQLILFFAVRAFAFVVIDTKEALYDTDEMYLSFNIDSSSLYQETEGGRLNFSNADLVAVAKRFCSAPGGAIVRIGGSAADKVVFIGDNTSTSYDQKIQIESNYWNSIVEFAASTKCHLVWDLCALSMRTDAGEWDSTNAKELFAHMVQHNQDVYGFQLGNEPGHYYTSHYPDGPYGDQLGKDFITLSNILPEYFPSVPLILGPDTCGPGNCTEESPCASPDYFTSALNNSIGAIDAVTVHHYGMGGAKNEENNCHIEDFLSPKVIFAPQAKLFAWRHMQRSVVPGAELILGETATAGQGGCPDLSNSYAAGFWWVHTLGYVASLGYSRVFRQDLVGYSGIGDPSYYALAGEAGWTGAGDNPTTLVPNPDYYTSLLWKQLMGARVLSITNSRATPTLSLHCHCTVNAPGAITIAYSNVAKDFVDLGLFFARNNSIDYMKSDDDVSVISTSPRTEYILTSGDGDLTSRSMRLNGEVITMESSLEGQEASGSLILPPISYGFIVLSDATAQACL